MVVGRQAAMSVGSRQDREHGRDARDPYPLETVMMFARLGGRRQA
jgi:hypothetical protein